MSMTIAIGNALSGLRTSQQAMETLSNNIANANTPGFTRKTVALESMVVGTFGRGVRIGDIVREVDANLNADYRHATSVLEKLRLNLHYYESIEQLYGQPGANNSIADTVTRFRSGITALATAPENLGLREQAIQDGVALANRLNSESRAIQSLRADAEREIGSTINRVNALLEQIADINRQVIRGEAQNQDVNALKDQRELYVGEIAQYMDVRTRETNDGNLVVTTGLGRTLVDNTVVHRLFTDTTTNLQPTTPGAAVLLGGSTVPPAIDITTELRNGNGQLSVHISQRDVDLMARQEELDRIATMLFDQIQSAALNTTDTGGGTGLVDDSNHFFAPLDATDPVTAYNIQVHPDLIADNTLLNDLTVANDLNNAVNGEYAFAAVTNGLPALTMGFAEYTSAIIERQSLLTSNTTLTYQQQAYVTRSLEQRVGQVSGVNIDEELAMMLQFQKSFSASGRLIQVTSEMLDELIRIAGR